jgi:hypothetical protein
MEALDQYVHAFSEVGLTREILKPYIRGKVIAIERPTGKLASLHHYLIRPSTGPYDFSTPFHAETPDEVGTVLLLDRARVRDGEFTDGSPAFRQVIVMTIVDASTRTIVDEVVFGGDAPRAKVGPSSDGTGSEPDRAKMVSYVAGLPQWNASLAKDIDLLRAARHGEASEVQRLVANGASLYARGMSPLLPGPQLRRYQLLFDFPSGPPPPRVPEDEDIPVAGNERKADRTPLMMAASGGHIAALQALIKLGADVNASDDSGETCLMLAVKAGKPDVVIALISAGADISAETKRGATAMSIAKSLADSSSGESTEKVYAQIIEALSKPRSAPR